MIRCLSAFRRFLCTLGGVICENLLIYLVIGQYCKLALTAIFGYASDMKSNEITVERLGGSLDCGRVVEQMDYAVSEYSDGWYQIGYVDDYDRVKCRVRPMGSLTAVTVQDAPRNWVLLC